MSAPHPIAELRFNGCRVPASNGGSVVERLYREVRALRIYEGTSKIQRLVIARSLLEARST